MTLTVNEVLAAALALVQEHKQNRIICPLTGVTVGYYDSETIRLTLFTFLQQDPSVTPDHLLDRWESDVFLLGFRPIPTMTHVVLKKQWDNRLAEKTETVGKRVELMIYMLGRVIFGDGRGAGVDFQRARNHFVVSLADFLGGNPIICESDDFTAALADLCLIDGTAEISQMRRRYEKALNQFLSEIQELKEDTFVSSIRDLATAMLRKLADYVRAAGPGEGVVAHTAGARAYAKLPQETLAKMNSIREEKATNALRQIKRDFDARYGGLSGKVIRRNLTVQQFEKRLKDAKKTSATPTRAGGGGGRKVKHKIELSVEARMQMRRAAANILAGFVKKTEGE